MSKSLILKFSCKDQPGIVSAVATFFYKQGFNIEESFQHEDAQTGHFFMVTMFKAIPGYTINENKLHARFAEIADRYAMTWEIRDKEVKLKILIAVSKWGHCLNHLLNTWKNGSLFVDIVGVVSNHEDMRSMVEWYGLPYSYLPVSKENKAEQEAKILQEMNDKNADCLILARYMQILSNQLCDKLEGRAINIHHSFLPGFKGAKPYHQAHERGVKLIGATAHFVTSDLDEGPIIEQEVERVSHECTPEEMVEIGRDIEAIVLSRAVRLHAEGRILLNGNKTVVFSR